MENTPWTFESIDLLKIGKGTDNPEYLGVDSVTDKTIVDTFNDGNFWIKGVEDSNGFFTLRLLINPKMALCPLSANSLQIIEIEEIFDQDVLGFKKFPFENQEVVSSRMSLSPRRKSIKFRC